MSSEIYIKDKVVAGGIYLGAVDPMSIVRFGKDHNHCKALVLDHTDTETLLLWSSGHGYPKWIKRDGEKVEVISIDTKITVEPL